MDAVSSNIQGVQENIGAENSVLGCLMVNSGAAPMVMDILKESDFANKANAIRYEAMSRIHARGAAINVTSVSEELTLMGKTDVGGMALLQLLDESCLLSSLQTNVDIVLNRSLRRDVETGARQIYLEARNGENTPESMLQKAESIISSIGLRQSASNYHDAKSVADTMWADIEEELNAQDGVPGIPSGFKELDALTGGLRNGKYIIIGARPAMGKTSLMTDIALNLVKSGHRVGIFSLEMSKEAILQKMVLSHAGVGVGDLHKPNGKEKDEIIARVKASTEFIKTQPVYIFEHPCTIQTLRSVARRMVNVEKVDVIFIDYAQLILPDEGWKGSRYETQTDVSRGFLNLKKELNIPIVVLVQLNRAVEGRQVKRPTMSDIRESGAYEQDADIIILIHREDYYKKPGEAKNHLATLIVGKNRGGPTGEANVYFAEKQSRFVNLDDIPNAREALETKDGEEIV